MKITCTKLISYILEDVCEAARTFGTSLTINFPDAEDMGRVHFTARGNGSVLVEKRAMSRDFQTWEQFYDEGLTINEPPLSPDNN